MGSSVLIAIIGVVFGGGLATSIGAVIRARPEAGKLDAETTEVTVKAAGGVVVMQSGLLQEMREHLDEARADIAALRADIERVLARERQLSADLQTARDEVRVVRRERDLLRDRVSQLEAEVARLKLRAEPFDPLRDPPPA